MSYPPAGGGYGYPTQNPGYPPQQPVYGQPPQANPGYGYGAPPQGGMPMPGAAPGYGQPNYNQPGYGQPAPYPAAGGMPMPGQPTTQGMAYAATAANQFRGPGYGGMPTPNQQAPYPGGPSQSPYPHGGVQPYPSGTQQQTASYSATGQILQQNAPYPGMAPQGPSYPTQPSQPAQPSQPPARPQPPSVAPSSATSSTSKIPQEPATQGTVRDFSPFDGQKDAEALRKAMKGLGTDEKAITQIVGTRSNRQRQVIKLEFATLYGKDLIKELKGELSGNYEKLVLALFMTSDQLDASEMFKAMDGAGTDERAIIEILCTRTNTQIQLAAAQFKTLYKKNLESELKSETSGHFRRLLVSLCQGSRLENEPIDVQKAADDARALYQAGEAKWGTDESRFNVILASRSFPQLRLTFDEYNKISKKTFEKAIGSEMSGDLKDGMKAIVKCARNRAAYFAECLYKSMKGLGTDDKTLVRVMVSRSELDMVQIKQEFQKAYGKTLASFINDDCSGDYKKLLLLLCGN